MVEVRTDSREDAVTAQVDDHGPGLSEADLAKIRQPFVRGAHNARHIRGAGLGLALVDHVAALHGGSLALHNRGTGLQATLRLSVWRSAGASPRR